LNSRRTAISLEIVNHTLPIIPTLRKQSMKRQRLILFMLLAVLVSMPANFADAFGGRGQLSGRSHGHGRGQFSTHGRLSGHGRRHGHGHGFGFGGFGFGGFYDYGWDLAELYRELYQNLPHFSLHPPVYYSYPVPRTYGYSPFAYPPGVMTPEFVGQVQPLEIINPHVPQPEGSEQKSASVKQDRTAAVSRPKRMQPEPLVIINPFVTPSRAVAQSQP
jgi:hypothetical protein